MSVEIEAGRVEANGLDMYYERGGQGEPLLFISGTGGDLRRKPNQFDSPLAQAFDLVCYDQRGLGQTSKPEGDYSMAQYADDAAALLDALGLERVPVIGVSFGGMVAQEFVLRHPDRVRQLVLCCTSAGGAGGASYPLHSFADLEGEARAEAQAKVADLRYTDEWIAQNETRWSQLIAMSVAAQGDPSEEARVGAAKQLEARRGHDTFARLGEIDVPVLLAGGEFDGIAPADNMRALQANIRASELHFFQGGHMFLIQDRGAWPFIIHWLRSRT